MLRQRGRVGLMAAALVGLVAGGANADVTTEQSASILFFPKVIADGTRDTIIQITNTSNSVVFAHCFYVNGALTIPNLPPGPLNPPLWVEVDFDIILTKQQPFHWLVSTGRTAGSGLPCGNNLNNFACNDAGISLTRIPPVVEYFTGELKCIEVAPSGEPLSGNHLKGEATTVIKNVCVPSFEGVPVGRCAVSQVPCVPGASASTCDPKDFDVAKYNAIGVLGNENNNMDNVLCLGGEPSDICPNGAEYNACPQFWIADHLAFGAPDPVVANLVNNKHAATANGIPPFPAFVGTAWTFVPCTQDFETQVPETVTIFIETWNEFEQAFSSFFTFTCWDEVLISQISNTFRYPTLGSTFAQSRLRKSSGTRSGFMMVGTQGHFVPALPAPQPVRGNLTTADVNYDVEGALAGPDLITIPPEQIGAAAGQ